MSDTSMTDTEWEESARPDDGADSDLVDAQDFDASDVDDPTPDASEVVKNESDVASVDKNETVAKTEQPEKRRRTSRPRGWLETSVKKLTDEFVAGEFAFENEKHQMTPHRIARVIAKREELSFIPSTGAVSAVFLRWEKLGFATFTQNPYSFVNYTDEGREKGLAALKLARSNSLKSQRDVEREAEREQKRQAKAEEKARKQAEREAEKERKAEEKRAEKARKKAERELAKQNKAAAADETPAGSTDASDDDNQVADAEGN